MRINLTLQQLQSFAEVAQRCNFREAAAALNVSQPALSRTIRMAEEALGTRLFDRDTRRVQLTPAGRELRPIAQRILAEFHGAFSDLAGFLAGRSGQVAVGARIPDEEDQRRDEADDRGAQAEVDGAGAQARDEQRAG